MSTLADVFGLGDEIVYDGKVYKLRPLSLERRGQYSRWLERRAREEAIRGSADGSGLPPEQAERYLRVVTQDIAAGVYEFGGKVSLASLGQPAGRVYAVYLALLDEHPLIEIEFVEKMVEAKLVEIAEIFRKGLETNDPKILAALGLTRTGSDVPQSDSQMNRTTGRSKKSKNSRRRK